MRSVLHISWKRLKNSDCAGLMLRLALVINDLSNTDTLLKLVKNHEAAGETKEANRILRDILDDTDLRNGLRFYAFRMQMGHLREGLRVSTEIRDQSLPAT